MHDAIRPVLKLLEDIGTARSLTVSLLIRHGEWSQVADLRCDPNTYLYSVSSPTAFRNEHRLRKDYVATDLLRKCADLPTGTNTKAVSVMKWFEAEKQCLRTNLRLEPYLCNAEGSELVYRTISCVRSFIKRVLGSLPPLSPTYDLEKQVVERGVEGRFGPGTTYSDTGVLTTVADKMSARPSWTNQAWEDHREVFSSTLWAQSQPDYLRSPDIVRCDRYVSVLKDATTDRGISIQPGGNVFYQLAYGSYIRERFRRVLGWDLTKAQEIHRQVAKAASVDGLKATLDLASASDTVAKAFVKLSLPSEWYARLAALRTTHTEFSSEDLSVFNPRTPSGKSQAQKAQVYLEKFSAMGNGYTFELETLLFAAICHAVYALHNKKAYLGVDYFVYGDDIIVDTDIAHDVLSALRFFGFTPNERKTFIKSEFRESCGGDYFRGMDVRPIYLKSFPKEPHEYIAFANSLRSLNPAGPDAPLGESWVKRAWLATLDFLPSNVRRCSGPHTLGDIVIHDEPGRWRLREARDETWYPSGPHRRWRKFWRRVEHRRGYFEVECWKPVRVQHVPWHHWRPEVILACATLSYGDGLLGITPRKPELSYGNGWTPVPYEHRQDPRASLAWEAALTTC